MVISTMRCSPSHRHSQRASSVKSPSASRAEVTRSKHSFSAADGGGKCQDSLTDPQCCPFEIGRGESFTLATGKLYKADGDEVSAGAPGLVGRFYLNGTDILTELDLSGYVVGTGVLIDCMTGEECAGLLPGDYGYFVRIFEDGASGESPPSPRARCGSSTRGPRLRLILTARIGRFDTPAPAS